MRNLIFSFFRLSSRPQLQLGLVNGEDTLGLAEGAGTLGILGYCRRALIVIPE